MATDYERRVHEVELSDGTRIEEPFSDRLASNEFGLRRVSYATPERELTVTLPAGDEVVLDVGGRGGHDVPPAATPIVYLDQNYWVLLSQELWAPAKALRDADRHVARRLIEMAAGKRIILPLAGAHLTEAPTTGHRRRHLLTTMLSLSRGWQMRSPLTMRLRELSGSLDQRAGDRRAAFTLEPNALFAEPSSPVAAPQGFSAAAHELHRRMTGASAFCAAVIEDEPRSELGRKLASKWADSYGRLASYMGEQRMGPEHAKLNARACMIADLERELTTTAASYKLDQERFGAWLTELFEQQIASLPYLGRVHELVYRRLRNPQKRWEINDLNDMHFLSCAAGYADVVVAEKRTAHELQQAGKEVASGACVFSSLPKAVQHLADLVPSTASSP